MRVRGEAGGGATYEVVTDELLTVSRAVLDITDEARSATIEDLPSTVSDVGDDELFAAFRDFCARWDLGLSHLVGDSAAMATRLADCSDAYLENEDAARGRYQQLLSCAPPPTADGRLVVYPGGL